MKRFQWHVQAYKGVSGKDQTIFIVQQGSTCNRAYQEYDDVIKINPLMLRMGLFACLSCFHAQLPFQAHFTCLLLKIEIPTQSL